jgi:hypothetical protein
MRNSFRVGKLEKENTPLLVKLKPDGDSYLELNLYIFFSSPTHIDATAFSIMIFSITKLTITTLC